MPHDNPREQLAKMMTGYWITQSIYVAAKLGLADLLVDGAKTAGQLAEITGTHSGSLYRLLRALASVEVFSENEQAEFALTPLAENLRSDVPGSQRSMILMMGEEHYRVWGDLLYSVQTGEVAFDKIYGKPIFDYLADHPEQAHIFDEAMTGIHGHETQLVLDAYDFSNITTLADIGGGNGSKLTAILQRYPHLRGILFDLPHVVERARPNLQAAGVADRCEIAGGNFFEAVPAGADAYLLRHIIHDWDDENCVTILRNCRDAMKPGGRVLVIESVIPRGNEPFLGKLLDLAMLLLPGGMERTQEQYRELLDDAGLRLARVVGTADEISVIESEERYPDDSAVI